MRTEHPFIHPAGSWVLVFIIFLLNNLGCQALKVNSLADRLTASNDRHWSPAFAKLPEIQFSADGRSATIKNIRNITWHTERDFILDYYDKFIRLDDVVGVDFIVVPFDFRPIAHTMISFRMADGTFLSVSVEIRTEADEEYSTTLGIVNQFEITYVVADERDVIRRRTRQLGADVYIYPTTATPEQSQRLFVDVFQRIDSLNKNPEFYNTITNNCTTNLVGHVNNLKSNRIPFNLSVLLPGLSDRYAHQLGILNNSIPFDELKKRSRVNELAEIYHDHPNFSQMIRRSKNPSGDQKNAKQ